MTISIHYRLRAWLQAASLALAVFTAGSAGAGERLALPDLGGTSGASDRIELPDLGGSARATDRIELPDIGASSRTVLSAQREQAIGEALMRALRRDAVILEDPEIETYLQGLGGRIVTHSDSTSERFTFFAVQDPRINAFAAPGGYVGVHTGLVLATESESELAAVLAHEVAHVTQGHIARRFEAASQMTIPTLAALAAAILLASQSGQAGAAAIAATQAGAIQLQIDFTRANEAEADRVGVSALAAAGFDPRSMPAFFERLQKSAQYARRPPEFLSTHPVTESRIADTRARAEQYAYRPQPDSLAFKMVRAKVQAISAENPIQAQRDFERILAGSQGTAATAARYGQALAMKRAGRLEPALAEMRALAQAYPDNVALRSERAQLEQATGQTAKALELFREGLAVVPQDRVLTFGYVDALLKAGRAREARDVLVAYGKNRDPGPNYYRLLARSQELAGNLLEAHLAMAEYQYEMGQIQQAVEHLERARKEAGDDFYAASRIDARLAPLKDELAELKARRRAGR
jgi:predicted Zn-dependent protease